MGVFSGPRLHPPTSPYPTPHRTTSPYINLHCGETTYIVGESGRFTYIMGKTGRSPHIVGTFPTLWDNGLPAHFGSGSFLPPWGGKKPSNGSARHFFLTSYYLILHSGYPKDLEYLWWCGIVPYILGVGMWDSPLHPKGKTGGRCFTYMPKKLMISMGCPVGTVHAIL